MQKQKNSESYLFIDEAQSIPPEVFDSIGCDHKWSHTGGVGVYCERCKITYKDYRAQGGAERKRYESIRVPVEIGDLLYDIFLAILLGVFFVCLPMFAISILFFKKCILRVKD